jgi:hypothetical protein
MLAGGDSVMHNNETIWRKYSSCLQNTFVSLVTSIYQNNGEHLPGKRVLPTLVHMFVGMICPRALSQYQVHIQVPIGVEPLFF